MTMAGYTALDLHLPPSQVARDTYLPMQIEEYTTQVIAWGTCHMSYFSRSLCDEPLHLIAKKSFAVNCDDDLGYRHIPQGSYRQTDAVDVDVICTQIYPKDSPFVVSRFAVLVEKTSPRK